MTFHAADDLFVDLCVGGEGNNAGHFKQQVTIFVDLCGGGANA